MDEKVKSFYQKYQMMLFSEFQTAESTVEVVGTHT